MRLDEIIVRPGRRAVDAAKAQELAESMSDIGLINPVTVTRDGVLVAGAHRLAAARLLGWDTIPVNVVDLDGPLAELAEIDENLKRNELHYIDRGHAFKRRDELLFALGLRQTVGRPKNPDTVTGLKQTDEIASELGLSGRTMRREVQIVRDIPEDVQDVIRAADITKTDALKIARLEPDVQRRVADKVVAGAESYADAIQMVRRAEKAGQIEQAKESIAQQMRGRKAEAVIHLVDCREFELGEKYDLLLTDPPYSTDVPDIESFIDSWYYRALDGVKDTGFAYIFIGAYPEEQRAYLNAKTPDHIQLEQVLIWTYKNTLGNNPRGRYKQNYQACLFYRGVNAPGLDCPLTAEQWAVQEINAPDGRQGDRYHAWQKPIEIAERFVRHTTKAGDLVYDPFACTGTFVLAAAKLGRRGVGCENDADNARIAKERGCSVWAGATNNP